MSVKVRLSRIGTKNAPIFRVVAIDSKSKRDGAALEILGTFNPVNSEFIQFHADRIDFWISQGAQATDTVKKLQKMYKNKVASAPVIAPVEAPAQATV